jgi:hypothetical protein
VSRGGFDIKALAKAINRRRLEHNRLHPGRPLRITPALSRILENDDEYVPYRRRDSGKRRRAAKNPSIRTLVNIARMLDTTVGDLLGEPKSPISPADRRRILDFAAYLTSLFRG